MPGQRTIMNPNNIINTSQAMNLLKKQLNLILVLITLLFLHFNLIDLQSRFFGWVLFVVFIILTGKWWQEILRRVFSFNSKTFLNKIFSWFSVFTLLGLFSSVALVFYRLTDLVVWGVYLLVALFSFLLYVRVKKCRIRNKENFSPESNKNFILFGSSLTIFLVYISLWMVGLFLLYKSTSTGVLMSPWQTISEYFLPVFFVLTLLSGLFLFSKYKSKVILFIFILQSILIHLYLPMSHEMPWGGDVWRHLAVENKLVQEEYVLPVLVGEEATWREVIGVDLPEIFLTPHKYSYGQLWGTSVLLSKTLRVDLLQINRWLVPILWSLVMPFILFRLGWMLFGSKRRGLWLVWVSSFTFPFQVLGAISLPVALGSILFLFSLMLWLQYLRDKNKWQRNLVLVLGLLMLFGYSLHFILFWLVVVISCLVKLAISKTPAIPHIKKIFKIKSVVFNYVSIIGLMIVAIFVLPAIEVWRNISFMPDSIAWWQNFKQLIGQLTGWFYAASIRPHDILSNNFIFNHTPDYAFVSNIFNTWRWWLVPIMIVIIILTKYSAFKILHSKNNLLHKVLLVFTSMTFGGYMIGWFVLEGDRLLTRRLDLLLAFSFVVFVILALQNFLEKTKLKKIYLRILVLLCVIIFSWFGTFTYASGPDMRVMSNAEYEVAGHILQTESDCVLADTYVLLSLEALSGGAIVGGGFPIDYQFGQKERVKLFNKLTDNPEDGDLIKAKELTNSESCIFVQKSELFSEEKIDKLNKIFDTEPTLFNGFFIYLNN